MLISPLMGPILAIGLSVGTNDFETLQKPELVDVCFEHIKNMAPIHYWLVNLDQSI